MRLAARVNGVRTGSLEIVQQDRTIAVRLGSVLDVLHGRYDAEAYERLRGSRSAEAFVSIEDLRSFGIPIRYDPIYDEVEFGIDYHDAPAAGKVQVEQIGAPSSPSRSVTIDQIGR